jgi:uncharacterized spore protein YtfJ
MEELQTKRAGDGSPAGAFIERMANTLGGSASAHTVFGEPIQRHDRTVVPVAKVRFGFGGGSGQKRDDQQGLGGGGGVQVTPVGFIDLHPGGVAFRRIRSTSSALSVATAVMAAAALWLAWRKG